jgi:sugar lactone lactonase YvrE
LGPDGLVLLVDGSLVVAGNRADKLVRIAPDGEVLDVIETPGDWGPTNIAAGDGYLMVTMGRGGRLCRIDVPWPAGQV